MNTVELLEKTLAYLEQPGRWNQGDFWMDKDGASVDRAAQAASCCIIGAVAICAGVEHYDDTTSLTSQITDRHVLDIIDSAIAEQHGQHLDIAEFNDYPDTDLDDIRDVLTTAINIAKEEQHR